MLACAARSSSAKISRKMPATPLEPRSVPVSPNRTYHWRQALTHRDQRTPLECPFCVSPSFLPLPSFPRNHLLPSLLDGLPLGPCPGATDILLLGNEGCMNGINLFDCRWRKKGCI